ncbi:MAG: hypothetical protein ACO3UT_03450 [Candidatus Nanopelagicaceae bacterium]
MISEEKKLAVLGSPIGHSLSPKLHNLAYSRLGVNAKYESFDVESGNLEGFLNSHHPETWRGFSLTMPLKEEAFQLISNLDNESRSASAVNTLLSDGQNWQGLNTDVFGFRYLFETFNVFQDGRESVSILGAGGTARAALVALDNFSGEIKVYRRNQSRDSSIRRANPRAIIIDWDQVSNAFNSNILINALPADGVATLSSYTRPVNLLIDALYYPWPTLLSKTQDSNYLSGKDLLVAQALRQIELFSGRVIARGEIFSLLRAAI